MSVILSHGEKQIVLYTKGRFKQTDMIEDLRKIVAKTFIIPVESTEYYHIYNQVTKLYLKLQSTGYIQETIEDFLCSLFKWKSVLEPGDIIGKMMGQISVVVADGLNLGEADGEYLDTKK